MSTPTKILAFAGSLRRESYNKRLVKIAAKGAESAGAAVTLIDLSDYRMPIYDEDLETSQGLPENAKKLKALFLEHQGLLISSPEYNSSIAAVLKNTIDWVSRPVPGEASLACFTGKTAAILSASPGALGGLRGLVHVRSILGNIGVIVLPQQLAIAKAMDAFNPDGTLKDQKQSANAAGIGKALAELTAKLAARE
jgi:chromate reductase, NAD(P)H dehydrogenase (quinone)